MIVTRVANTDPFGSGVFFLDPDPVFKFKIKSAERALKVIY